MLHNLVLINLLESNCLHINKKPPKQLGDSTCVHTPSIPHHPVIHKDTVCCATTAMWEINPQEL